MKITVPIEVPTGVLTGVPVGIPTLSGLDQRNPASRLAFRCPGFADFYKPKVESQ